jgi:hypothetical protein
MGKLQVQTQQGALSIECDDRLRSVAQIMLAEAEDFVRKGGQFRDGYTFLHGWSLYRVKGGPGDWHIEEPDFGSDPYANSRPDCTFTLSLLAQQFAVGERIGLKPSQMAEVSCFDMILHPNCLRDRRIRAERTELRGQKFSGWELSSLDRVTTQADDMVTDVATLTKIRPALLRVILLPVGYTVELDGNDIRTVTDPSKQVVYRG